MNMSHDLDNEATLRSLLCVVLSLAEFSDFGNKLPNFGFTNHTNYI